MQRTVFSVCLLIACTSAFIIKDCSILCRYSFFIPETTAQFCGCPSSNGDRADKNGSRTTPSSIDVYGSTMTMCDYLCSIQQGGSACDCSVSIVPGK